jgi:uncharacterized protein (TIGR00369 family)
MAASPFIRLMGLRITALDAEKGELEMVLPHSAELMRADDADGMFHGGAIATLIDTAGDFVVAAAVGGVVPTINFRVDYFRPGRGAQLRAVATARRIGRAVCVADVEVYGDDGKVCAIGRGTYSGVAG